MKKQMIAGSVLFLSTLPGSVGADTSCPDYANPANWSAQESSSNKPIDVFFVHPTTYFNQDDGMNASLDNATVNQASDDAVQRQAAVFTASCNLFAPRYRQASIAVLPKSEKEQQRYLSLALQDVTAAFDYYLKNLNQGRPYILASHSQGSNLLQWMLLNNPDLINKSQLVSAYLIGFTFTDENLAAMNLPLATRSDQLGGLITWNTISEGADSPVLHPGARCINPLSWTDDPAPQPADKNDGAVVVMSDGSVKRIAHFTAARIGDNGGLIIPPTSLDDQFTFTMGPGVYHGFDYDFFYRNLVENVSLRCTTWLKQHPKDQ